MNAPKVERRETRVDSARRAGGVSPLIRPHVRTHTAAVNISRLTPTARRQTPALGSRLSALDSRRGFTLIELLVVIAIISLLIAILGVVLANMGQQAKETATNTTIKKIHAQLEQRIEAFDREMERLETFARKGNAQSKAPGYDFRLKAIGKQFPTLSQDTRIILLHKDLMREKFPQAYGESPTISSSKTASVADSSELLYIMLTQGESGGAATVDAGEFLSSETGDTDNDGRLEFLDGWGNPLRFYRTPTRLIKSNGTAHTQSDHNTASLLIQGLPDHTQESLLKTDPHDPLNLLAPAITLFKTKTPTFESRYHTPNTYFIPLVVSAGADGLLGLGEPNEKDVSGSDANVVDFGYLAQPGSDLSAINDNITNRNQRSGD